MTAIKKKAKEHSLEPRKNAHCGYDEEDLEDSFEAGANYVLDAIEKLVKFNRWAAQDLYELIEQLKK